MIKKIIFNFINNNNYIKHHLEHLKFDLINFKILNNLNSYSFWTINLDTFLTSIFLMSLLIMILSYLIITSKKNKFPNKIHILFEILILFIYNNVLNIYKKKDKFIFSLSFCIFTWIFCINLLGLIPIDLFPFIIKKIFYLERFLIVLSSDINVTSSISFIVILCSLIYKYNKLGFLNFLNNFLFSPFENYLFIPINIIFEIINIFSKLLSLSLRLFGNIYSGEIIFILIYFIIPIWGQLFLAIPIMFLHLLISFLQSFIFMILTLIYIL